MSLSIAATSDQVTVRPDDLAFWEIVCADDDWLRTEFDAIVAAEYPDRHRLGRARPSARRPPEPPARGTYGPACAVRPLELDTPARPPARQRSPPPRA